MATVDIGDAGVGRADVGGAGRGRRGARRIQECSLAIVAKGIAEADCALRAKNALIWALTHGAAQQDASGYNVQLEKEVDQMVGKVVPVVRRELLFQNVPGKMRGERNKALHDFSGWSPGRFSGLGHQRQQRAGVLEATT